MNSWQYIGAILTGIAALITAGLGVYDKLQTVHQAIYTEKAVRNKKIIEYGLVNDKDGWVYLREKPDVSSTALAKLINDTNVRILNSSNNWYQVYTESGRIGYIYKDRLIITKYEN